MKLMKIIMSMTIGLILGVSLNAFAGNDTNLHMTKHNLKAGTSAKSVRAVYVTDIHVINNSSDVITIKVPMADLIDTLYPYDVEDIYSDLYYRNVEVILRDSTGYIFFHEFVPNHSVVDVRDCLILRSNGDSADKPKLQAVIKPAS